MAMTYATVCSGVEGCSLALDGMGWQPVFFSEIEPFPCAVLKAHYPNVPNLGDMSKISYDHQKGVITNGQRIIQFHGRLDLLAGGTPCQDFSVAGKRAGGAEGSGTRSSLMWQWLRLASELRPRVVFWENVVGCLSTNNGRDFSQFVSAVGELGYCVAWRVLDCQYTRVDKWPMAIPQRRRRVWLVGCADAEPSDLAEILFEHRSLIGDSAPCRRTRQEVARFAQDGNPLHARMVEGTIALEGNGQRPSHRGSGINEDGAQFTLNCIEQHGVAYKTNPKGEDVSGTLSADDCMQSGQDWTNNSVVERTIPFVRATHARGKDGDGERWEQG
ncbi:MAG: DNA (cytosine-5-)-methyltransferase, partial [Kiritimatiellae bacterium]|nr:DNA (cytosine-5-)-methyltransferase [Kiritimatiellia bacterium]